MSIEFSCHTWAFNDLTLQEALGTVARLGFRYVDIGSGQHLNAVKAAADPRRVADEILGDLRVYNLKLGDVYLLLPRISAADENQRRREITLYTGLIPFMQAIGAPGITLSPGVAQPPPPIPDDLQGDELAEAEAAQQQAIDDAYNRTRESLAEMISVTPNGMLVSIEPHLDSMAPTPDDALKLVDDVPELSLTLDWSHMICQNIKHRDIVGLLPHTRHVQLRQAARNKLQTQFDKGKLDLEDTMAALHNAAYDGLICVEYMQTPGWHGMVEVDTLRESILMRDALRELRGREWLPA